MSLEELMALMRSGNATPEQLKEASELFKGLGTGKVPPGAKGEFGANYSEFAKTLMTAFQQAANTPQGKQFTNMLIRERQSDRFVRQYKPFFNAVLQGIDIGTALSQVRNSNKQLEKLVPPAPPSSPRIDPSINNQIYEAQRGTFDSERALAPAREQLSQAFNSDIANAKAISGGQSGTFGALANAANLRRVRGATGLPLIADQIKAREQSRLDDLLFRRQGLAQQGFENNLALYDRSLGQFNQDVSAVGELGATGRANLRNTLTTAPENYLRAVNGMMPVQNPYEQSSVSSGPTMAPTFNPAFSQYGEAVSRSLAGNLSRIQQKGPRLTRY